MQYRTLVTGTSEAFRYVRNFGPTLLGVGRGEHDSWLLVVRSESTSTCQVKTMNLHEDVDAAGIFLDFRRFPDRGEIGCIIRVHEPDCPLSLNRGSEKSSAVSPC